MEVSAKIRDFIRASFLVDDFADTDSFLATGLVDSLGMLQLVAFVESEFGFSVHESELVPEHFDSVAAVSAFVNKKRARAA